MEPPAKFIFKLNSEIENKVFRRSIFVSSDVKKGEKFSKFNIRKIRPGYGVDAKYYHKILLSEEGKKAYSYLEERGLSKNIIEQFQLGYSPDSSDDLLNLLNCQLYKIPLIFPIC